MGHLITLGNIVYLLYNWKSKIRWYYDFKVSVWFVDPMYEQEFIDTKRQGN
jgi:hypothetical protein